VDPLDCTNNFAIGLSTFALGVTALAVAPGTGDDDPVGTAVHVPVLRDSYVARRGAGGAYNGMAVGVEDGDRVPCSHATVACVIGRPVLDSKRLQDRHAAITDTVATECKRLIQTWAPLVH
jgi:fructose-1,6-bisphosphatase/inositol monophosphatase family enzyme